MQIPGAGVKRAVEYTYTIEGRNWARRSEVDRSMRVCKDGRLYRFYQEPQKNGVLHSMLGIEDQKSFSEMESEGSPFFCGSIWDECTLQYAIANADRASIIAKDNGILECEIDVPTQDAYKCFKSIPPVLTAGGKLRLLVDVKRGYVTPRVEFLTPEGIIGKEFVCENFVEIADGIFYPKLCRNVSYLTPTKPGLSVAFTLLGFQYINEDVPDKEFEIELPPDTFVTDKRLGATVGTFRLNTPSLSIADAISQAQKLSSSNKPWGAMKMTAVLAAVVLFAAIAGWWWRNYRLSVG